MGQGPNVPTAERARRLARGIAGVGFVVLAAVAGVGGTAGASGDDCPPGLADAPGPPAAPGVGGGGAPGLPPSASPVLACIGEPPTTEAPTTTTEAPPITLAQPAEVVIPTTVPLTTTTVPVTTTIAPPAPVVAPAPVIAAVVEPPPTVPPTPTTIVRRVRRRAPEPAPVLAFTAPPETTTTLAVVRSVIRAAPAPPPTPTTTAPSERPAFVLAIPRPHDVSWSVGHVGANASLALGLVLLLGLPAELLNSSIKERFSGRSRRARLAALVRFEEVVNRLPDPVLLVGFGVASAVIYAQLDPSVGLDSTSMLFVGALAFALIIVTGIVEAVRIPYLRRRHQVTSHLRMFPKAFVIAALLVIVSRLTGFHPGFIFGVTCGLAVSGRLRDEDEGRSIAIACAALLAVAAACWLAWMPVSSAASVDHPSTLAIFGDTFLATLWVTALQVVLFGLLPLQLLYGEKVLRWSRSGWLALYGAAMFLFVQTLFHPQAGDWGGFSDGTMLVLVLSAIGLSVASVGFWAWVRIRPPVIDLTSVEAVPEPAPVPASLSG